MYIYFKNPAINRNFKLKVKVVFNNCQNFTHSPFKCIYLI